MARCSGIVDAGGVEIRSAGVEAARSSSISTGLPVSASASFRIRRRKRSRTRSRCRAEGAEQANPIAVRFRNEGSNPRIDDEGGCLRLQTAKRHHSRTCRGSSCSTDSQHLYDEWAGIPEKVHPARGAVNQLLPVLAIPGDSDRARLIYTKQGIRVSPCYRRKTAVCNWDRDFIPGTSQPAFRFIRALLECAAGRNRAITNLEKSKYFGFMLIISQISIYVAESVQGARMRRSRGVGFCEREAQTSGRAVRGARETHFRNNPCFSSAAKLDRLAMALIRTAFSLSSNASEAVESTRPS